MGPYGHGQNGAPGMNKPSPVTNTNTPISAPNLRGPDANNAPNHTIHNLLSQLNNLADNAGKSKPDQKPVIDPTKQFGNDQINRNQGN